MYRSDMGIEQLCKKIRLLLNRYYELYNHYFFGANEIFLCRPIHKKKYSGFTAIWSCASVSGTQGNNWCCATGDSSTSCCNASFGALVTGGAFMPGLDQFILNITQAAQQNSSSTNVNASSLAGGSDNKSALGTKVGLGVGVPLGVLVLGLLTWLFFRERSKNHARRDTSGVGAGPAYSSVGASGNMEQSSSIASPMHANTTAPYYSSYDANNNHSGMQGQQYHSNTPKNNLYGGADSPVYEVPSTNDIHEMRG